MLPISEGLSVDQAVKNYQASNAKDSNEQPVADDVVNVSEDAPKPDEVEAIAEVEAEESETVEVEQSATSEEIDELFYEIDGEEVSASQLSEWRSGGLKQADYTRKTTAHAEEVKVFKEQQAAFKSQQALLSEKLEEFEALSGEEALSDEDVQDLREYEPTKYIEYIEKKQKRADLISQSKTLTAKRGDNFEQEYNTFANSQAGWLEDNKPTELFKSDVEVMTKYADANGFTQDDLRGFKSNHFKTLLDAAKYNASKSKTDVMTKKVRKAPPITKPKQQATSTIQTQIDRAKATFLKSGKVDDAVKLAALKRQLNNN